VTRVGRSAREVFPDIETSAPLSDEPHAVTMISSTYALAVAH